MKNLLILLLSILSVTSYGQIAIDSTLSTTTSPRVNIAATASWVISGTDTYSVTVSKVKLKDKCTYSMYFTNGNTGSATLSFNGGSAITFKKWSSGSLANLTSGDITSGQRLQFTYNGTYLILASGGSSGSGSSTFTGLTDGPGSFTGKTLNFTRVNAGETALEYQTPSQVKTDIGLSNVDNTSDASKPVSTLQATADALNLKIASNLSDLNNAGTARTNLGLGTLATQSLTFGTGVATALAINVGSAGAPVLLNGAGGTPSSLTLTNATGLPPTTGISGWPSNASGALTNNGSGTLSWVPPGLLGYTTTATAAGTTTLTASSNYYQYFTGTNIQTVQLPVVSTLTQLGQGFEIDNLSTGNLTVNSSGGNAVATVVPGGKLTLTAILLTGTTAASWNYFSDVPNPMTAQYDMMYGGGLVNSVAQPTRIPNGTTGQFLMATTSGAPTWSTVSASQYSVNQNSTGLFAYSNTNTLTSSAIGSSYQLAATIWGYQYVTPSSYAPVAAFSNAMVYQTSAVGGQFIWSNGATIEMELDANKYLRHGFRVGIGSTTTGPSASLHLLPAAVATAWVPELQIDAAANTALTASTAFPDVLMNGATQTWGSGTIAIQPKVWVKANTLAGTSGTNTATVAAGIQVDPWAVGTNGAITNNYTIYSNGKIGYPFTYTAGGTTGDQTINKPTGSLNIAATGTTVTLTNSFITANSIVFPVLMTSDATATSVKSAVVTAGQCVFTLNAACTAEIKIGFEVKN